MPQRQFVAATFREGDRRAYTYHWDGTPFRIGDQAKAPDKSGDGWVRVHVVSVGYVEPAFKTKPLLGKLEPEGPAQGSMPLGKS